MPRTKIVHIITSLDVGGAEHMLSNLVLNMDQQRFENVVISLKSLGFWGDKLLEAGINVYALDMQPRFSSLGKLMRLYRILQQIKPDYIQGWMYHANLVALLAGKLMCRTKVFWNVRCSAMDLSRYRITTRVIFKFGAWLSKYPDAILNNSQASIKQHYAAGYRNKNLWFVPNGFDLDKFKPDINGYRQFRRDHKLPVDAKLIGMFARFDPMKDHNTFIAAAAILAAKMPDVYFVLAGKDVDEHNHALTKLISANNIQSRVILLGRVENMQQIYPAMDYVTQTSVFGEGFPNVLGEAMACGVPCFATDVGDSLQILGDLGQAIPTKDPQALAGSWSRVLESGESQDIGLAVRERIKNNFSLSSVTELYQQLYLGAN